jgi:hypothetical protein
MKPTRNKTRCKTAQRPAIKVGIKMAMLVKYIVVSLKQLARM